MKYQTKWHIYVHGFQSKQDELCSVSKCETIDSLYIVQNED